MHVRADSPNSVRYDGSPSVGMAVWGLKGNLVEGPA